MGVQKITFDGANVSAKQDADLHHFLFSSEIGILRSIKTEVSFTLANNIITFSEGYAVVYGRLLYIENNTTVNVNPDSTRQGLVVLGVNTATNQATIYTKENSGSYPALTRDNLLNTNGLYELVLCAYSKTTTSVTLNTYSRLMIDTPATKLTGLRNDIRQEFNYQRKSLTTISNGVYRFSVNGSQEIDQSLIVVMVNISTAVVIPGAMLFINTGSNTFVTYQYGTSSFSMLVSYENNLVTVSLGNTTHRITALFLYR